MPSTLTSSMTARSVVLSLLLGAHPARLPVRDLVAIGEEFGIPAATMRVALSRMATAGDLVNTDAVYALSARHLERQAAQEAALSPSADPYDGSWTVLVVTETGRDAASRAGLRATMRAQRLAELREGVWTRPATLPTVEVPDGVLQLRSYPDDDHALAARLWDLDTWSETAHELLDAAQAHHCLRDRFVANAAIVRHLRTDPVLPAELRPADWPADALHRTYDSFRAELNALRSTEERS